jgi:AraC-like DNA-binding protein
LLARFRAATGTSPMKWLTERREEEAKRRLREEEDRVRQSGRSCGFRSDTAFRETFRQHTGLSPKQYQQQQHRRSLPAK